MNFLAVSRPLPAALRGAPTAADIARISVGNEPQLVLLEEIADLARQNRIEAAWLDALRARIRRDRAGLVLRRALGVEGALQAQRRLKQRIKQLRAVKQALAWRRRRRAGVEA